MKEVLLVEDNPADVYLIQRAVADCGDDIHLSMVPDGAVELDPIVDVDLDLTFRDFSTSILRP